MTTQIFGLEQGLSVDIDEADAPAPVSILDRVRADAKQSLSRLVTFEVPTRPGYKVSFDVNIEKDDVERWTRNAQGKKRRPEDMNTLQMAAQALLESNRHILLDDTVIGGRDGNDLVLGSREWVEIYDDGGSSSLLALRAFMGDGVVQSLGLAVLKEAGYGNGDDLYAEDGLPDPTKA